MIIESRSGKREGERERDLEREYNAGIMLMRLSLPPSMAPLLEAKRPSFFMEEIQERQKSLRQSWVDLRIRNKMGTEII